MLRTPWPREDPQRPAPAVLRLLASVVVVTAGGLAAYGAWRRPDLVLQKVVAEEYATLEWVQVWVWLGLAAVAAAACATQRLRRGVYLAWWLGVVAGLAALRELDLHVVLNPLNIHLLGLQPEQAVRFRLDWLLDGEVSAWLKAAWGLVFGGALAAVLLPFALAGYPWPRRLLNFGGFAWLVATGFGLMALAYVEDDLMRHVFQAPILEEVQELVGQLMLLAAVVLLALGRVRLYGGEAPDTPDASPTTE